jgi:hypothetical protein
MFFGNCVGVMSTLAAPALKEDAVVCEKAPYGSMAIRIARTATIRVILISTPFLRRLDER